MEANKVLLIFETLAPSAFIIEPGVGGAGLGAASRKTLGRRPTWPGRDSGALGAY